MRENAEQNNSAYGHFSRSGKVCISSNLKFFLEDISTQLISDTLVMVENSTQTLKAVKVNL